MRLSLISFTCHRLISRWTRIVPVRHDHQGFKNFLINRRECLQISYRTQSTCSNEKIETPCSGNSRKLLKIAIIGVPNAGKSTLINQIVGRNVFAVSSKVHTTRCCARAVAVVDNTQLVFLDTPGLVSIKESIKHHLERPCIVDSEEAVKEADIIGVIHDAANEYTREKLDEKVLRILLTYPRKRTFLVLNKIDAMKSKRKLLDCVDSITKGRRILSENIDIDSEGVAHYSESDLQILTAEQIGWPYFEEIFMVSALSGDGVGDIQMYLLSLAKPGDWMFTNRSAVTDQSDMEVIERTVFGKLLDHLPNVIPYNLCIQMEYFDRAEDGSVTTVVLITAEKAKIKKLVLGKGGSRIKKIATDVEQSLRQFYLADVRMKLVLREQENLSPECKGNPTDVAIKKARATR